MKIDNPPLPIRRELILRMIAEKSPDQTVRWLNALPEAKALLHTQFAGTPISETDLAEWRFSDSVRAVASGEADTDAYPFERPARPPGIPGLPELLQQIVENYARFSARWQADPENPRFDAELCLLKSLAAGVLALCRLENQSARLQLARERFDLQLEKHRAKAEALRDAQGATGATAAVSSSKSAAAPPQPASASPASHPPHPHDASPSGNASLFAARPNRSFQTYLEGSIAELLSPPQREPVSCLLEKFPAPSTPADKRVLAVERELRSDALARMRVA
jgi:hypothetical protein